MSDRHAPTSVLPNRPPTDFMADPDEMMRLFREGVQREIAEQLAAGQTVYYCSTQDNLGKLFMLRPDGRRFEYRVLEDGTREIVREIPCD
jgi:hypothetical protein